MVNCCGLEGFIPVSHLAGNGKGVNLANFIGQEFEVKPLEKDRRKHRLVFSRKDLVEKEATEQRAKFYDEVHEGDIIEGEVSSLTDFGVFVTIGAMVTGALCSLSLGPCPSLSVAGQSLFDFFDFLSANVLLPAGGFFTCLYVGWVLPRRDVQSQLQRLPLSSQGGAGKVSLPVLVFLAVVRFVCPLFIFLIFLHQLGVI